MVWEEELALNLRKVTIDFYLFKKCMRNSTDRLNTYFVEYNLPYEATSDLESYIGIQGYKSIKFRREENGSVIISSTDETENFHIEISTRKGMYLIHYYNSKRVGRAVYFLTEDLIDELISDVVFQNKD